VAALFDTVAEQHGLAARLLGRPDGERLLTDLRHVAESLHREQLAAQLGLTGLLSWLRGRTSDAGDADRERSRRLDTDASAVQVVTVHTSKGLEFPVVLVPYGWDAFGGGSGEELPAGHDGRTRTLHVGGKDAPGYGAAVRAAAVEQGGEELRLLYVAVTRAVSRLVLWWGASRKTAGSPLHRLLLCDDPSSIPVSVGVPGDDDVRAAVEALGLPVEDVVDAPVAPLAPPAADLAVVPQAAVFDRPVDTGWRRTSYTGLTRAVHEAPSVGSEPQADVKDDEEPVLLPEGPVDPREEALRSVPSPMADLPGGTWFGTLVHAVLEDADLAGGPAAGLRAACAAHLAHRPVDLDPDVLADALLPAVSTPLGPLGGGLRWRDVPPGDRVAEMAFELPLAGGDDPTGRVLLGGVADLLDEHLPPGDRMSGYAARLRDPQLAGQPLRGYLTGSLDAVVRLDGPRYVVVDHKTNRLGERGAALTAWHYRQAALDDAVLAAHYPLQALLYAVALHRVLRWRQPGYDPEQHLGGVLYLFLRGMCGEGVGDPEAPPGVWAWRPPAPLVGAVSDLLAARR
ncbi:MAG TPA: 3'-5' exonuclease, partial [Mycobacteriales bacterium]|nr:3'-5' exonuclease [Mycobacteriales bacterium]